MYPMIDELRVLDLIAWFKINEAFVVCLGARCPTVKPGGLLASKFVEREEAEKLLWARRQGRRPAVAPPELPNQNG